MENLAHDVLVAVDKPADKEGIGIENGNLDASTASDDDSKLVRFYAFIICLEYAQNQKSIWK